MSDQLEKRALSNDPSGTEKAEKPDRMDAIDLEEYYTRHADNPEWLTILGGFPPMLQREIIIERPNGTAEDIDEFKNYRLVAETPQEVEIESLIHYNIEVISLTPQDTLDQINRMYGTDIKTSKVYDANPGRVLEYAKMPSETAKPSVMVNGVMYFGVGRFMAALLRGDKTIRVWDLRTE